MQRLSAILPGIVLLCAGSASAANAYVPFTFIDTTQTFSQGLWLADSAHPGNPPVQISNQTLDGPVQLNIATLNDWTFDAARQLAVNVQPQLVVYGIGGHLFKVGLSPLTAAQPFSNGTYQELCSLIPLDARPFAPARSYVQAVVQPVGSPNTCADNVGTQTWLIAANATATTAPILRPSFWSVLGAFTDPSTGAFVKWIIWTGNEVDTDNANFTKASTLLVGPPAGPAPFLLSRSAGTAFLLAQPTTASTVTSNWYRLTPTTAMQISSATYANTAPCAFFDTSMIDPATGQFVFIAPNNTGYQAFATPIAGGPVSLIYSDNSGLKCGAAAGDAASAGFITLDETDETTFLNSVIGINEAGPATQTKVVIAGGTATSSAAVTYTINGHAWIPQTVFGGGTTQFSLIVADGNGTVLQNYLNTQLSQDGYAGFSPGGSPVVDRGNVYLFHPNGGVTCAGGTLESIDATTFASTTINGLAANSCRPLAFGFGAAQVGQVATSAGGSAPIQIDPSTGQVYFLLGPQSGGAFTNAASLLFGYPFF
jgi:hypothetical protein